MHERADALDALDGPLVLRPPAEDGAERVVEQARGRGTRELRELRILGDEPRHEVLQHLERGVLGELGEGLDLRRDAAGFACDLRGLLLADERAGVQPVELRRGEPVTDGARLLAALRRQPVVVDLAVRRLPVTDEEERAHATSIMPDLVSLHGPTRSRKW